MLYQTHHPFFFQFHPVSATPTPSLPLLPSSSPLQVETEMECVEAALKSSFRKEMAVKLSPQAFLEESWAVSGKNGASCDDFFVDGLLDFSNEEEEFVEEKPKPEAEEEEEKGQENNINYNNGIGFSAKNEFESEPTSELAVPADDLADLEWLSHFVEDSFSEYSAPFPAAIPPVKPKNHPKNRPPITPAVFIKPCFNTPVPAKARSKRTRTGGRVWSLGSASLSDSSSSPTSSSCSSPSSPWLLYCNPNPVCSLEKPVAKKLKRKPAAGEGPGGGGAQPPRRCSHCGVQKTPQWRTGPLGAKTLCNACGVRYKSGRLLPEYRPACSPTFSSQLHSNHHRKVLEMRKKKEVGSDETGSDLTHPVVPSF